LIIQPYAEVEMNVVDDLTETERGEGGFGSTGKL
jgi:dUTP pyrophosphatase